MSKEDWFRQPCLTPAAWEQFEQQLKRARSARPEYMKIQAHALQDSGAYAEAVALLDRLLDEHPDHLSASIYENRAEANRQLGNIDAAIRDYLSSISEMKAVSSLQSSAPLRLAGLVWETKKADLYEPCFGYLTDFWDPDPIFPRNELQQFGWTAVLLDALGLTQEARPPAFRALSAASATKSKAANHPTTGLSIEVDRPLVEKLREIVSRNAVPPPQSTPTLLGKLGRVFRRRAR